jgi:excisionase family DNA binding protein
MTTYLTIDEAAQLLRITPDYCRDLCRRGKIPGATQVTGRWLVDRAKLMAHLEQSND